MPSFRIDTGRFGRQFPKTKSYRGLNHRGKYLENQRIIETLHNKAYRQNMALLDSPLPSKKTLSYRDILKSIASTGSSLVGLALEHKLNPIVIYRAVHQLKEANFVTNKWFLPGFYRTNRYGHFAKDTHIDA